MVNQQPPEAIRGHPRPSEAIRGHPKPSAAAIGYAPCFSMNFWSAAEAENGTISLSEKCSDDGRRDDDGPDGISVEVEEGMKRLLPKLISLPFFFWEFSANEVEFSARSASRLGVEVKEPPLPETAPSLPRPLTSSISCVGGAGS